MPSNLPLSTYPRQKSAIGGDNFLWKVVPEWLSPAWLEAQRWRVFVQNQPLAVVARETLIANVVALDWKLVARDSNQQDELKEDIKYYTKLLENSNGMKNEYSELDFSSHIEWIAKDLLDLPFGGASEIGREGDEPEGKVLWIRPLDGGTLAPTLNRDYPIIQRVPEYTVEPIYFPYYSVSRTYMSPRTEIRREGWGMAPPEKIYLAMELMYRGEKYYANLLLNTPEVGILDLGDMESESAKMWIESFRDLMYGTNPFKIPVLYEHNTETKWIPFGKLPNELMFDNITMRYASLIAAGYGMSISDLGFPTSGNGGETLSGTIRQERRTKRTGYATLKKKLKAYFDNILPESIELKWIDYDDELQVSLGRARLANAQAWQMMITAGMYTSDEGRLQTIQDGLVTISIPEKMPEAERKKMLELQAPQGTPNEVGNPQKPSLGGQGEISAQQIIQRGELVDEEDEVNDRQAEEIIRQNNEILARMAFYATNQIQPPSQPNINVTVPIDQLRFDNLNIPPVEVRNEIQVNPTPVEIRNEVTSPDVVVNVDAPQVDITNEVQPTPIEITNQVSSPDVVVNSPVEVNLKQSDKLISTVYRDQLGRIAQVETEQETDVTEDDGEPSA